MNCNYFFAGLTIMVCVLLGISNQKINEELKKGRENSELEAKRCLNDLEAEKENGITLGKNIYFYHCHKISPDKQLCNQIMNYGK